MSRAKISWLLGAAVVWIAMTAKAQIAGPQVPGAFSDPYDASVLARVLGSRVACDADVAFGQFALRIELRPEPLVDLRNALKTLASDPAICPGTGQAATAVLARLSAMIEIRADAATSRALAPIGSALPASALQFRLEPPPRRLTLQSLTVP